MRRLAAATAALALLAAGCGEKEETVRGPGAQPFEVLLDYFPNADHAPIYAALGGKEFERAGLDVKIRRPSDPAAPIKQVAAGRVDLALSYEPEVMRARDKGLRVVAVGALVRGPLTSIISLPKAKIDGPEDLRGKTIGTAGIDYQSAYLDSILAAQDIPRGSVKVRNVGFNLTPMLLTGKVDATLGAFWNYEGIDLAQRGKKPRIIRMDEAGVPVYDELVFVANASALESQGPRIRRFIAAVARGARAMRRDPERGVRPLLEANRDLDAKLQRAVVKATMERFVPPRGKPYGWQEPREWSAFADWMHAKGLVKEPPSKAFTNDLLPGQGIPAD